MLTNKFLFQKVLIKSAFHLSVTAQILRNKNFFMRARIKLKRSHGTMASFFRYTRTAATAEKLSLVHKTQEQHATGFVSNSLKDWREL